MKNEKTIKLWLLWLLLITGLSTSYGNFIAFDTSPKHHVSWVLEKGRNSVTTCILFKKFETTQKFSTTFWKKFDFNLLVFRQNEQYNLAYNTARLLTLHTVPFFQRVQYVHLSSEKTDLPILG